MDVDHVRDSLVVNIMAGEVVEPARRTGVFGMLQGCLMLGQGIGLLGMCHPYSPPFPPFAPFSESLTILYSWRHNWRDLRHCKAIPTSFRVLPWGQRIRQGCIALSISRFHERRQDGQGRNIWLSGPVESNVCAENTPAERTVEQTLWRLLFVLWRVCGCARDVVRSYFDTDVRHGSFRL